MAVLAKKKTVRVERSARAAPRSLLRLEHRV